MGKFISPKHKQVELYGIAACLNKEWGGLCAAYLPVFDHEKSIWRYSRPAPVDAPRQGWKIHLSATVLSAANVLRTVAPFLKDLDIQFKAPVSLFELMKLNAGVYYGYSQIGKFITVYPASDEEFAFLVEKLHRLTVKYVAPSVPLDFKYRKNSNVFYRYGVLRCPGAQFTDEVAFLIAPDGAVFADDRGASQYLPDWVKNPLKQRKSKPSLKKNPLQTTYKVFRALAQRGKGGVYLAVYNENGEPRRVVLKEGRRHGETSWDGRDGFDRIRHEKRVFEKLQGDNIPVPPVLDYFCLENNYYLVTKFIDGRTLRELIGRGKLPLTRALGFGIQIAAILAGIHASGWVWRDCKPENIIVSEAGNLRVLDFEGACRVGSTEPLIFSTPGFTPPEALKKSYRVANTTEDLYALGRILLLLLVGNLPLNEANLSLTQLQIDPQIKHLIGQLLDENPQNRPPAQTATRLLNLKF